MTFIEGSLRVVTTLALTTGLATAQPAFHHMLLVDVSGSMRNTLGPPASPVRRFLAQNLLSSPLFAAGQPASLYGFSVAGHQTREYQGGFDRAQLEKRLVDGLPITREDTDLVYVLQMIENEVRREPKPALTLAWIITDNVNDPRGAGADVQNTRAFYSALFREGSPIQRMYFFPLKDYRLVVYLLVCGPDPALYGLDTEQFEESLRPLQLGLGAPRIRAKPVGGDAPLEIDKRIRFSGEDPSISTELVGSGPRSTLIVRGLKEGQPLRGRFEMRVRSRFDEWRVSDAQVEATRLDKLESADFPNIDGQMAARLTPTRVSVDPRSATSITYALDLGELNEPQTPKAPFFKLAAFNPDGHGVVQGRIVLRIGNPKLTLQIFNDDATTQAVKSVFHLEDIGYFVPRAAAGRELRLDFAQRVEFDVGYNYLRRWAVVAGMLAGAGILWLVVFGRRGQPVFCRLVGYTGGDSIALAAGHVFPIVVDGERIAELRRGWSGGVECRPAAGVTVNGKRGSTALGDGSPVELRAKDTTYVYRLEIIAAAGAASSGAGTTDSTYY